MRAPAGGRAGSARSFLPILVGKKWRAPCGGQAGCRTTILRPPQGPLKGPGSYVQHRATSVRGPFDVQNLPVRPLNGGIEYRTRGRRRTKTVHRTGPGRTPAGRREDPGRAPTGRRAVHLFIGRSPEAYRTAPGQHLYGVYGLLTGALRLHSTNFHRTPPGCRTICDHSRRRNENRKGPVRSLKSTASRRVGKIVRGPVDMWPRLKKIHFLNSRIRHHNLLLSISRIMSPKHSKLASYMY